MTDLGEYKAKLMIELDEDQVRREVTRGQEKINHGLKQRQPGEPAGRPAPQRKPSEPRQQTPTEARRAGQDIGGALSQVVADKLAGTLGTVLGPRLGSILASKVFASGNPALAPRAAGTESQPRTPTNFPSAPVGYTAQASGWTAAQNMGRRALPTPQWAKPDYLPQFVKAIPAAEAAGGTAAGAAGGTAAGAAGGTAAVAGALTLALPIVGGVIIGLAALTKAVTWAADTMNGISERVAKYSGATAAAQSQFMVRVIQMDMRLARENSKVIKNMYQLRTGWELIKHGAEGWFMRTVDTLSDTKKSTWWKEAIKGTGIVYGLEKAREAGKKQEEEDKKKDNDWLSGMSKRQWQNNPANPKYTGGEESRDAYLRFHPQWAQDTNKKQAPFGNPIQAIGSTVTPTRIGASFQEPAKIATTLPGMTPAKPQDPNYHHQRQTPHGTPAGKLPAPDLPQVTSQVTMNVQANIQSEQAVQDAFNQARSFIMEHLGTCADQTRILSLMLDGQNISRIM